MIDLSALGIWRHRRGRGAAALSPSAEAQGTLLGETPAGERVTLRPPTLEASSSSLVFGASGVGKSVALAASIVDEYLAAALPGEGVVIVDVKNDLINGVCSALLAAQPERAAGAGEVADKVRWIDPFAGGFPLNLNKLPAGAVPLDIRAGSIANLISTLSTGTGGQAHLTAGSRQIDLLTNVLLGAFTIRHPAAHPLLAIDALQMKDGLGWLGANTTSDRVKQFCSSTVLSEELRVSTAARLRASFAATEALEQIVTASACLDFDELISPGVTVIVLGAPIAGLTSLSVFWANLLVRLIAERLLARKSNDPANHHVRLCIDEAHLVVPALQDLAEVLITTGRSRNLSLVLATQSPVGIEHAAPDLWRLLLTNTPTKILGRLSAPDAELLSRERAPKLGSDATAGAVRGRLVSTLTSLPDREFILLKEGSSTAFRSRDVDVAGWRDALDRHADTVQAIQERYALPKTTSRRLYLSDLTPPPKRRSSRGWGRGASGVQTPSSTAPDYPGPAGALPGHPSSGADGESGSAEPLATAAQAPAPKKPRSRWG